MSSLMSGTGKNIKIHSAFLIVSHTHTHTHTHKADHTTYQTCSTTVTQQYLYPCGTDGEEETVQWDERFGCFLQTTRRGVKAAKHTQDTHTHT